MQYSSARCRAVSPRAPCRQRTNNFRRVRIMQQRVDKRLTHICHGRHTHTNNASSGKTSFAGHNATAPSCPECRFPWWWLVAGETGRRLTNPER